MKIEVSEHVFRRLQELAVPLVDTVEDVIVRLLDEAGTKPPPKKGGSKLHSYSASSPSPVDQLRGLQRELWELVVQRMPFERFTLRDVYARMQSLKERRPHVKELEASVRGSLEKLRDKGFIEFIDNRGSYRRLK